MAIVFAVLLVLIGIVFAANMLGSLTGRYSGARRAPGQMPTWVNVLLAGSISAVAFTGAFLLLS